MVTDRREFIRLDVGYFDNPKVGEALDTSPLAVVLHIASMAYARQHRTDGRVPIKRMLRKVGADEGDARTLLELGLWENARDGYVHVHDYAKHQETRADIEARSNAARKANQVRWNTQPIPIGSEPDSESPPIGNPEKRREEERRETATAVSARDAEPPPPEPVFDQKKLLASAGLATHEVRDFLLALKGNGARNTTALVNALHRDGKLTTRIEEWRTERDLAREVTANTPRVITPNITKASRGADRLPVVELCAHDFEVGRCPKCRAESEATQ
jgi:hypothetical protein